MAFVVHLWRLLNLKLELPFQAHIVKSLYEINTCSRSGCLSVTNALNKSTSCTFERPYRVLESSGEEESLFRGLPSSRNRLRFWALALSLGSLSGVINTELASPSTSLPLLLLESSSELMFSSVSVEDWTNLCKEACLAVRFLRKLGASKETNMSLSGELSWPFSEEIEVRFVISFIADIIRRQNATNFGGNEMKDPSTQRSNMRMNATENKANFRANEPSVMIGRFQPRFHKVKLEWNDREKGKGKRFTQNCAVSSLRETLAREANGFLVCSSFVFQKVKVSLCFFPLAPFPYHFLRGLHLAYSRGLCLWLFSIRTTNKKHTRKTACYEG